MLKKQEHMDEIKRNTLEVFNNNDASTDRRQSFFIDGETPKFV